MDESLSNRLKLQRKALGLTQQQAALACGVARETWSRYEGGDLVPGLEVIAAFARAGADVRYLVGGDETYVPRDPLTGEEQVLLGLWRPAGKTVKRAVMSVLLSDSEALSPKVKQVFKGPVGAVADNHGTVRDVTIHQDAAPYRVTPKKVPKDGPKQP